MKIKRSSVKSPQSRRGHVELWDWDCSSTPAWIKMLSKWGESHCFMKNWTFLSCDDEDNEEYYIAQNKSRHFHDSGDNMSSVSWFILYYVSKMFIKRDTLVINKTTFKIRRWWCVCVFYRNLKKSHLLIWFPDPLTPPASFSWCLNVTVPTARTPSLKTSVLVRPGSF